MIENIKAQEANVLKAKEENLIIWEEVLKKFQISSEAKPGQVCPIPFATYNLN